MLSTSRARTLASFSLSPPRVTADVSEMNNPEDEIGHARARHSAEKITRCDRAPEAPFPLSGLARPPMAAALEPGASHMIRRAAAPPNLALGNWRGTLSPGSGEECDRFQVRAPTATRSMGDTTSKNCEW